MNNYLTFTNITHNDQLRYVPELSLTAIVQLVLARLEEDSGRVAVVLGSCEGQVEGEAGSEVAPLPAGGVTNTNLVIHVDVV